MGHRRHLSTAGGTPLPLLEQERVTAQRLGSVRGLDEVAAIAEAIRRRGSQAQLGFVDLLLYGDLDHPVLRPKSQLYNRREVAAEAELPRSAQPVFAEKLRVDLSTARQPAGAGSAVAEADAEAPIEEQNGRAADGTT